MENTVDIKNYPEKFNKLAKLIICSNELIGGGDLAKISDFVPLVIGSGHIPQIWITSKYMGKIYEFVKRSQSYNNLIKIIPDTYSRKLLMLIEGITLISARMISDTVCVVDKLDLRPLGLNIYGNDKELTFINNKFSGSTMEGVSFMFGTD
ncbi:hypothetical protein ACH34F_05205 [Elizabethkingia anophelis]|uniref:hypothetical protein n=1 Tax=Elizabethkingia anophelis TaxID=1117645 RepID=UPI000530ECD9|nr:hypothetical protein NV63_06955 [Elizabethkingia anophelis]